MSERWLRYFEFWRRDPRRDVDDEIRFHLEARVADLVQRGLTPEAASRSLRIGIGRFTSAAEIDYAAAALCAAHAALAEPAEA